MAIGRADARHAPVDGCGAPVLWQQGTVQVDPAKASGCQAVSRKDLPIIANYKQVGIQGYKLLNEIWLVCALWIEDCDPSCFAGVPRWVLGSLSPLTRVCDGPGHERKYFVIGIKQRFKSWYGKGTCTKHNQTH